MNKIDNNNILEQLNYYLSREKKVISNYYNQKGSENWNSGVLFDINNRLGCYNFISGNINQAKNYFNTCGLLDIYSVNYFNSTFLDYGFQHVCFAILSDNEKMIQRYAKLRYKAYGKRLSMDEYVLKGEGVLLSNTIQFFMENSSEGIERNLNIYEMKKEKILRGAKMLELDYEFFKALYVNKKSKMEEILEKFLTPRIHKKRTDSIILDKFISLPALGYAKLAWRKGIEIEVNSPLIPKELLPIKPLEHYEIPYEFLKEK